MSYQIKRTPYFQRMFNNSKRNGQLQRLREEYERIQEFNDRTIEMKMRQVRLKRLFREIEDINESPSVNEYRRHQPLVPMSPEALHAQQRRDRLLALERARELGQEISRRNAALAETGTGYYLRSELRLTAKMRAVDSMRRDAQERRQRAARRLSYGNAQSRSNMERIGQRRLRRQVMSPPAQASLILDTNHQVAQISPLSQLQQQLQYLPHLSHMSQLNPSHMHPQTQNELQADLIRRAAMLHQRLEYGNSRSSNNMLRSQRLINCLSMSPDADTYTDDEGHVKLQRAQQLLRTGDSTGFGFSSDENINIGNSETEMQTAMLPPTELEALPLEDDVPTTSQMAQTLAKDASELTASITTCDAAEFSNAADGAPERWHRISLTLPWVKVMSNHPTSVPYDDDADADADTDHHQMANSSIALDGNELANSDTDTTGSTTNYKSSCAATLMHEDLMHIVELNEADQRQQHQHQQQPTMRLRNHGFDHSIA